MSIIAVTNMPLKLPIQKIVISLGKVIEGEFEIVNCVSQGNKNKTCYVRLSERLDPQQVVQQLRESSRRFKAHIPSHVPDVPLVKHGKLRQLKQRQRRAQGKTAHTPGRVFILTHMELMTELQSKFVGLYNLSRKTGHDLLESIAKTVFDRLKNVVKSHPDTLESGFCLTSLYRRLHPHFGDFQMIMSNLHRLQDAANVRRAQLVEADLVTNTVKPGAIDNVPFDVIKNTSTTYSKKIAKKLTDHINALNDVSSQLDSTEDKAQKKVRTALKKITPYIPLIVTQVINNHFVPEKAPFHRFRIYGEPSLPRKELVLPFLAKFGAVKIIRSDRIYNMLRCNVSIREATAFQDKDGTMMGDNKLIIRSSDIPLYKIPASIKNEVKFTFGEDEDLDEFLEKVGGENADESMECDE